MVKAVLSRTFVIFSRQNSSIINQTITHWMSKLFFCVNIQDFLAGCNDFCDSYILLSSWYWILWLACAPTGRTPIFVRIRRLLFFNVFSAKSGRRPLHRTQRAMVSLHLLAHHAVFVFIASLARELVCGHIIP